MNRCRLWILVGLILIPISPANAAVVIDGALGSDSYGGILFFQDTATGFGDNTDNSTNAANGSEIDGVYGVIDGGNLNILVTGNIETNFNRLVLYIDSIAGGQTTLNGGTGGGFNDYSGLVFDSGFSADFALILNGGGGPVEYYLDFGVVGSSSTFLGGSGVGSTTIAGSNGINVGIDQSNVSGVTGASIVGANLVTTGMEFAIPLSVIGSPTGDIRLAGFVAGGGFLSNQLIGGVGGAGNLGNSPDLSSIAGNQFITITGPAPVPEPISIALIGLGSMIMLFRGKSPESA